MELNLSSMMADFLAKGGAVTTLDYAGNPVGEHRDIDLDEVRVVQLVEKKVRGATPKTKFVNRVQASPPLRSVPKPAPVAKAVAVTASVPEPEPAAEQPVAPVAVDVLRELRAIRKRAGMLSARLAQARR